MMADAQRHPVDIEQLRVHAANLDVLRELLGEIRFTVWEIHGDQAAFGSSCQGILPGLGERCARHHQQMAYVEENLLIMIEGLRRVADGSQQLKDLLRRDDDVATIDGTPIIEESSRSLRGLVDSQVAWLNDRQWAHPLLTNASRVKESAVPAGRLAALRIAGLHYATTSFKPLQELLDKVTGDPHMVAAQAHLWHMISADLHQLEVFLQQCLDLDLPRRDRLDVQSYLALMSYNVETLTGLAEFSSFLAVLTEATSDMALQAREIISGIVGDLFARVISWAIEPPATFSPSELAARFGVIVATAWRIHAYIAALTDSIDQLAGLVDD